VTGQPDGVGILLDRRLCDLLGRLMKAGVDDLETRVPKGSSHHLRTTIVPVQPGFRHHDAVFLGHNTGSLANGPTDPRQRDGAAAAIDSYTRAMKRIQIRPPGLKPTTKVGTLGPYRGRLGLAWVIAPLVVGVVILVAAYLALAP
jgi:hypothetical protein